MGFELWEVLTAFTVALTLASILMWYSNIQPRQNQESYLWLNQEKNSLYNMWLQGDNIQKNISSSYVVQSIEGECGNNLNDLKITKEPHQEITENLEEVIGNSKNLTSKIDDSKIGLRSDPEISVISKDLTNYLEQFKTNQEDRFQLSQTLLDTQKMLSETCQTFYTLPASKSWLMDSLTEQIKDSPTEQAKALVEEIKSIKGVYNKSEDPLDDKDRSDLNVRFNAVWKVDYKDLLDSTALWESKNNIIDKLKDYEQWERGYTQNKDYLISKSVFIWPEEV